MKTSKRDGALPQRWTLVAPDINAFREALDELEGHIPDVVKRLGLQHGWQIHWLRRRQPEFNVVYEEWRTRYGKHRSGRPKGTAMSDAQIAALIDQSATQGEAARRTGYSVASLWVVQKRATHPLSGAAYARLQQRVADRSDPRPRLLRAAIDRIREAMPTHGHITRHEWRRIALECAQRAEPWPRKLHYQLAINHKPVEIALLKELAELIPETGYASRAVGASRTYIGYATRDVPELREAWDRAYRVGMIRSNSHERRVRVRDWWTRGYSPQVRRQRAAIIDGIVAKYGGLLAWERDPDRACTHTRSAIERWMREDRALYRPGLYKRYPPDLTIRPTCDKSDLREPAMIMRHVASGDRWWQWGKWVAWVGDADHSARLMLEHAIQGLPVMTRRLERVTDELWTLEGWAAETAIARWNAASGRVEWRT